MKRFFDVFLIVCALPLVIPVVVLTALASWVVQGRGVIFIQERAGLNGKPFKLYKFRSMRGGDGSDAERLSRFGKFLRASSIDELPELWNVLKGEMSLVGPRPLPVSYLPRYTAEQNRRHEVLPGITGWAQVNGRNQLDWETKFKYDVWYVDHQSLVLDFKILILTVFKVFSAQGISATGEATMSEFVRSV